MGKDVPKCNCFRISFIKRDAAAKLGQPDKTYKSQCDQNSKERPSVEFDAGHGFRQRRA